MFRKHCYYYFDSIILVVQVPKTNFDLQVFKHVLNPKQPPDNPQSPFSIVTALVDRIRVQSSILPDQVRVTSEKPEPLWHYIHFKGSGCSTAVVEHTPCNREVVGLIPVRCRDIFFF